MKLTLNNPFVVYGYKGEEYFCDRRAESIKLIKTLGGEQNVTLSAPRRMGKTGLIKHIFSKLEAEGVPCFYIDIFPTKSLEDFVNMLASAVLGKLDSFSQSALRKINEFFSQWRPTVSLDQLSGMPTVSLDIRKGESEASLKQIFEYLKQSDKRCYIAIDEFQQILQYPEKGVEAMLRSYIQFLPNVYFIFSGSQQHIMEQMFLSSNRPFFQSTYIMQLNPIDRETYRSFANKWFGEKGLEIDADTFSKIYDFAKGITWYIQSILHNIYENPVTEITPNVVNDTILEFVKEQSAAYQNYCLLFTENQLKLLTAIASENTVKEPLSATFIRKYKLSAPSSVKTALRALMEKQFISRTAEGYFVTDLFFACWLRYK
ncbi:MAG: ATP-binding protein [Muribaculaceae bacterium]